MSRQNLEEYCEANNKYNLLKEWDYQKNIGITPKDVYPGSQKKVWWICANGHEWETSILTRKQGNSCPICSNQKIVAGYNDLATTNPSLAKEWDIEKNGSLSPSQVAPMSKKKVWWICDKGHSWESAIYNRHVGRGCPFCANKKLLKGYNDLATTRPDLAKEWNYQKNKDITPEDIFAGTNNKKFWWICPNNHEYAATAANRNTGYGCPYCKNKKVQIGYNDLFTTNPELKNEWDYKKNKINPEKITYGNDKKAWWICSNGHSWEAVINSRTKGIGCPYCSGRLAIKGKSDLLTINPEIIKEWNYKKNIKGPEEYTSTSGQFVWWIGKCGHEWKSRIAERTSKNKGCPYCSGRKVLKGFNDLESQAPKLAKEWNYEKNGELRPYSVTAHSNKKIWWKCDKGHEWQAYINNRIKNTGCPYCANFYVLTGFNDLLTTDPDLAEEWNYEKNGDIKPSDFTRGSEKRVWWKGKCGHEWQATIANHTYGFSCPICCQSHLEKYTKKWLDLNHYEYDTQVKFEGLTGYGDGKLSYDFGIKKDGKIVCLIECQGRQHYKAYDFFGGEEIFAKQQLHDELKRDFAQNNKITLLEIPHTCRTYKNVSKYLENNRALLDIND